MPLLQQMVDKAESQVSHRCLAITPVHFGLALSHNRSYL